VGRFAETERNGRKATGSNSKRKEMKEKGSKKSRVVE